MRRVGALHSRENQRPSPSANFFPSTEIGPSQPRHRPPLRALNFVRTCPPGRSMDKQRFFPPSPVLARRLRSLRLRNSTLSGKHGAGSARPAEPSSWIRTLGPCNSQPCLSTVRCRRKRGAENFGLILLLRTVGPAVSPDSGITSTQRAPHGPSRRTSNADLRWNEGANRS